MGKRTYRFCYLRKWKDFKKKNSLPYLKRVLRLSCEVHRPIYERFMGFYVNGFLSIYPSGRVAGVPNLGKPYGEKTVYIKPIKQP